MSALMVDRARKIAEEVHEGQRDKAGKPYIDHVARVAASVSDDTACEVVAWLHDVLEDGGNWRDIAWLPYNLYNAVNTLTRDFFAGDDAYYAAVRSDHIALRVKLADIADNADESRLSLLDEKVAERLRRKYRRALEALT